MGITHAKASSSVPPKIAGSDWDADHVVTGLVAGFIGAKAYHSTTQGSLTAAQVNALSLDSEEFDTDGFHSTVTNTSRMTIPTGLGGKYLITGKTKIDQTYGVYIRKNGSGGSLLRGGQHQSSGNQSETTVVADLVAGDYVEVVEYHGSGTGTAGDASNDHLRTELSLVKLDAGRVGSGVGAKAYNSTTQTVNGDAVLTLDSEEFDTDEFHSTSSNTGRMTIPTGLGGKYLVQGGAYFAASGGWLGIVKNSSAYGGAVRSFESTTGNVYGQVSTILDLAAGDYVQLLANTSASVSVGHASLLDAQTWLSVMRLDSTAPELTVKDEAGTTYSGNVLIHPTGSVSQDANGIHVKPPRAHGALVGRSSGDVSVGNNTFTVIPFTSEDFDTDSIHDNSTNNSRLTVPSLTGVTTGLWLIEAVGYTNAGSGRTDCSFRKNANGSNSGGTQLAYSLHANAGGIGPYYLAHVAVLSAGDYVECFVRTTAGSYSVIYDAPEPMFSISFLGAVT